MCFGVECADQLPDSKGWVASLSLNLGFWGTADGKKIPAAACSHWSPVTNAIPGPCHPECAGIRGWQPMSVSSAVSLASRAPFVSGFHGSHQRIPTCHDLRDSASFLDSSCHFLSDHVRARLALPCLCWIGACVLARVVFCSSQ